MTTLPQPADVKTFVKMARIKSGRTQDELAKFLGVTKGSISGWENGRYEPSFDVMSTLSAISGLMLPNQAEPPQTVIDLSNHPDLVAIRRVGVKASAGLAGFAVEDIDDGTPIFFRKDWCDSNNYKPEMLLAMRVMGDSMEPSLWHDDLIVVNTATIEPKDGAVFALMYEGVHTVKRLQRDAGQWWMCSDNADQRKYARKACSDDACKLIGEVVYKQSERI
jgi:phage repressor protein C with HTH and peptisase S24 domain